jgi:predicted ribosome quality control (RQC) complex YloA/Tae2 family protein
MLSYFELQQLQKFYLENLLGAQLQGAWSETKQVIFALYHLRLYFLIFQFSKTQAQLVLMPESDFKKTKKESLPVTLFAWAHLKNQRVTNITMPVPNERILKFEFDSGGFFEFRLIPGNCNLSVSNLTKVIWLQRPQAILAQANLSKIEKPLDETLSWSFEKERIRYQAFFGPTKKAQSVELDFQKKRNKMIKNIEQDIEAKQKLIFDLKKELDQLMLLQDHYPTENLVGLKVKVDLNQPWYHLKEHLFETLKKWNQKVESSKLRLHEVQNQDPKSYLKTQSTQEQISKVMQKKQIKGRFFEVQGFVVAYGKSGADSLKLLRAAQPWDLWFHVRDGVGAHFILRRQKHQSVPESVLQEVGIEVLKVAGLLSGGILVTEARFVFPIKGAAPGLVRYTHERVMHFSVP